jgi:hypothetical protein
MHMCTHTLHKKTAGADSRVGLYPDSHPGIFGITGLVHKGAPKNATKTHWAPIARILIKLAQVIANFHGG